METDLNKTFVVIHKDYEVRDIHKYVKGNFDNEKEANELAEKLNLEYFKYLEKNMTPDADTGNQYLIFDVDHLLADISKRYNDECD